MDKLRGRLIDVRCRNDEQNHYFYPHESVHGLITSEIVRKVLVDNRVKPYELESAARYSADIGGRRIFAILVLIQQPQLYLEFIRNDKLQRGDPDHKLPYGKEQLKRLLPFPTSEEFWDKQWEFTAPFFSESVIARVLPDEFILPYLKKEYLGEGALGQVFKIQIEQSYLPVDSSWQGEVCSTFS